MITIDNKERGEVDVTEEIGINYAYNKNPRKGYQCVYTDGMEKYGAPELCLMDYYTPEQAEYILYNMSDIILNSEIYNPETEEYDFFGIVDLVDEQGNTQYIFGFIGGWLYGEEFICLQLLDEDNKPVHPGVEFLPSWNKRGFEPYPTFMYVDMEEEE